MIFRGFASLSLVLLLAACGGGSNPDRDLVANVPSDQRVGGEKVTTIGASDSLKFNAGKVDGTGTLRFASPLASADSANRYVVRFALEPEGRLTVVGNADANLNGGVEVEFVRGTGADLKLYLRAQGTEKDWSSYTGSIDASALMTFAVEIHNDEGEYAHIEIRNVTPAGDVMIFDSAEAIDGSPGRGTERLWGLKLNRATVFEALRQSPTPHGQE